MPVNKADSDLRAGALSTKTENRSSEELLIQSIQSFWSDCCSKAVVLAGGDDCAIARTVGRDEELLLTTDQIIENQHFIRGKHPFEMLGHKALVRSLSDIAAMGGRPIYFLLSLALPEWSLGRMLRGFVRRMRTASEEHQLHEFALIGGDVARADLFAANVTVAGVAPRAKALRRSGAKPGDRVYVSGRLGGSLLGLQRLLAGKIDMRDRAIRRHCRPLARLALGVFIREQGATAAIDLSDGLSTDALRLANAGGVAIRIDSERIPLFPGATVEDALASGEEYELLFTAPPQAQIPARHNDLRVTQIGTVASGAGLQLERYGETTVLESSGFDHFAARQPTTPSA